MLILALVLLTAVAWALAGVWVPGPSPAGITAQTEWRGDQHTDRWVACATLFPAMGVALARLVGAERQFPALVGLGGLAGLSALLLRDWRRGRGSWPASSSLQESPRADPPVRRRLTLGELLPLGFGLLSLSIALIAARGLPIWQWDALGYHLPFVAHALQGGSLADVPWDKPYLGTYPHAVELWDLAARQLMADDSWLDAAELPLSLCGAVAVAGLASRAGARLGLAAGFGLLWLTLPAAFLQLPSCYLDVPAAGFLLLASFWLLAPPTLESAVLCALALGLYLDSKPTALTGVAVIGLALVVRQWRHRPRLAALATSGLAGAIVLALGLETYATNLARFGNPLWPIALDLGPLHLPGPHTLLEILGSGAAAPHLTGPLPWRLVRAWTALHPLPSYDMRVGGFGPLFTYLALPLGLWGARRGGGGGGCCWRFHW